MDDCIFCKISKGEIPCNKIWENKDFICFLDIEPVTKGHTLVVPKEHFETLDKTPNYLLSLILPKVKETAEFLIKKLGAKGFNILQNNGVIANQSVPHLHFHIIPIYEDDDGKVLCGKSTQKENKNFKKILEKLN